MHSRNRWTLGFTTLFVCLVTTLTGSLAYAEETTDPAGHWKGAINLPGTELEIQVDLEKSTDGWAGTIDIPAQGLRGFTLSDVTVDGKAVGFMLPNIPGDPSFAGNLTDDRRTITGQLSQNGQIFPFKLERKEKVEIKGATPSKGVPGEGYAGYWQGSLKVNAFEMRLLFHLEDADGELSGTMVSLDQGETRIPLSDAKATGDQLRLESKSINGTYNGRLNADGSEIVGQWKQGPQDLPLTLKRLAAAPDVSRPQDPKPPYPYANEDVAFPNEAASIELAGTFTFPETPGPHPAVILVSGSGPQDRDETIMGHRPFLVLADHLTRHGIAVLRYDDRGVGESTGRFSQALVADFTTDALAAVEYLKTRPEVDPQRIGILGHSEGGLVAPQAAVARPDDVAFIVLLAGPGVPMDDLLARQAQDLMRLTGADAETTGKALAGQRDMFRIVREQGDSPEGRAQLKQLLTTMMEEYTPEQLEAMAYSESQIDGQIDTVLSPWFRDLLELDPRPTLEQVRCPVLAINGGKDSQVATEENLAAIEAALRDGGNGEVTLINFPDQNHLFQEARTGAISEYATIEETMNPETLEAISDWVREQTAR